MEELCTARNRTRNQPRWKAFTGMDYNRSRQTRLAYQRWIAESQLDKRFKPYLLTFMFDQLPGSEAAMLRQMQREIEHFYTALLTRILRNPISAQNREKLPRLFAAADRPVPKREKQAMEDVAVNDGLHFHAVLLVPRESRLQTGLKRHVRENNGLYLGSHGKLRRIHVKRVKDGPEKVADYLLKAWRRTPSLNGELLVLPRAVSELPDAGSRE